MIAAVTFAATCKILLNENEKEKFALLPAKNFILYHCAYSFEIILPLFIISEYNLV